MPYALSISWAGIGSNIDALVLYPGSTVPVHMFGIDAIGGTIWAGGGQARIAWVSPSGHVHAIRLDVLAPMAETYYPAMAWSYEAPPAG